MFYGQFFTALCGFGQLTCAWITRHSSGTQAEVRRRLGSSAALPSEGSLQLRAPLDSNSSASLWLSADTSSPGGTAPGPLSWRLGDVLGWQSGRHADLTVWLVVKKLPVCRLGRVVYPPCLLRGAHLNVACCQRWSGRFYTYFFISPSLVEFPLMFLASSPVPTSISCARWSCCLSRPRPQSRALESSLGPAVLRALDSYSFQLFLQFLTAWTLALAFVHCFLLSKCL